MDLLDVPVPKSSRTKTMSTGKVRILSNKCRMSESFARERTVKAREIDEIATQGRAAEA